MFYFQAFDYNVLPSGDSPHIVYT